MKFCECSGIINDSLALSDDVTCLMVSKCNESITLRDHQASDIIKEGQRVTDDATALTELHEDNMRSMYHDFSTVLGPIQQELKVTKTKLKRALEFLS